MRVQDVEAAAGSNADGAVADQRSASSFAACVVARVAFSCSSCTCFALRIRIVLLANSLCRNAALPCVATHVRRVPFLAANTAFQEVREGADARQSATQETRCKSKRHARTARKVGRARFSPNLTLCWLGVFNRHAEGELGTSKASLCRASARKVTSMRAALSKRSSCERM